MDAQTILHGIKIIGLKNALLAIPYARERDRLDRLYAKPEPRLAINLGSLRETQMQTSGAKFIFENAEMVLRFLAADLARIEWTPGILPVPYGIEKKDWDAPQVRAEKIDLGWRFISNELDVLVRLDGSAQFSDRTGKILRDELPPERYTRGWTQRAKLTPEECLYGLGERAAHLNLRGGKYQMWNSDVNGRYETNRDPLYLCVPTYLGLHDAGSYLVFYENTFRAEFDFGATLTDQAAMQFGGGALVYYFIPGPLPRALERYTELTGRAPLPPRWALGYHHSHIIYRDEKSVRQLADGFRTHDLPLSAVHLDLDYMDGYRVFTIEKNRFPDLAGLARDLDAQDVRLVAIVDTAVKEDKEYDVYRDGIAQETFCKSPENKVVRAPVWPGWSAFPDFTNPKTRAWWKKFYARLLDAGVSGLWQDMNEPATFAAWGDYSLPLSTRHSLEGRGGDHREAHNIFGMMLNEAGFNALRAHRPDRRPFIVTRSGWAGLQRYAWTWTGDSASTWQMLMQTIATGLGLSLSGIPYTGPDVGGTSGEVSSELYTRWFQLAAFLPFFRTYEIWTTRHREPWDHGEPYLSILRDFLRLRYRLMPYWYTLAWQAAQTGHPLVRPLFWCDPTDRALRTVDDAFMLGDHLLVAPVGEEKLESREVYLPRGEWYSFWDDSMHQGGATQKFATPLERIPLFVRAGSVMPMDENGVLVLHIYPGAGTSQLYSDAGDGYGESRVDQFEMMRENNDFTLKWTSEGTRPSPRVKLILHGMRAQRAWRDGIESAITENKIETEKFKQIRIEG